MQRIRLALAAALAAAALPAPAFFINLPPPPPAVLEFFNETNGHYVLLSDPAEIAAVDRAGGWVRTGYVFEARDPAVAAPNVCRFYAPYPTNSHFFTADAAECEFLRTHDTGWIYEKTELSLALPSQGRCDAGLQPVYRLYNGRWRERDSNHRFVADAAARDDLVARGWIDEGIGFCTTGARRAPLATYEVATEQVRPSAECEDESINLGPCVGTNQLPRLANRIDSWQSPWYVTLDPRYSESFTRLTGFDGNVYTAQPVADPEAVASHSFAQTLGIGPGIFGIRTTWRDRTTGDLSSINPLYQFPTSVRAGEADTRVFPWRMPWQSELRVSFRLDVRTVRRLDADSHAYGHPTLQFKDVRSGRHVYVTVVAYSTLPAGTSQDLLAMDASTGRPIVGTSFRADPWFGRRIAGEQVRCQADASMGICPAGPNDRFAFRLTRDDFATVLARARTLVPELSPEPDDYLIANFHFNNEIYRNAEAGLRLWDFRLERFGF